MKKMTLIVIMSMLIMICLTVPAYYMGKQASDREWQDAMDKAVRETKDSTGLYKQLVPKGT